MEKITTVWNGEISGIGEAVMDAPLSNILILSDLGGAISAVKKEGRTGRARTGQLRQLLTDIKYWQ